tara:strand:- start:2267 stop:3688 length:1422 start_codon:yes stop_codon:yes gene_type:complete
MKKNFLTVAAMMVVAFFVSAEIAKAADVTFSGQIRTRWDATEQFGGGAGGDPAGDNQTDDAVFSSVRLGAKANVNETTTAFIQLQSTRNWGDAPAGEDVAAGGGERNASNTANDNDSSVGVHQAYMQFKNFLNLPMGFDAKIGRQEVLLDGWRLFGNTIWTPGMQSHDMVRLDHKHDNTSVTLGYILEQERDRDNDPGDNNDSDTWFAYVNQKGVMGGALSLYYIYMDQQGQTLDRKIGFSTVGFRQAGKMWGFDYRGEFYYQFGDANGIGNNSVVANRTANGDVDFDAYMLGVRVGRTAKNTVMKPSLTVWYDYLSGTNDSDGRDGTWSSFDTIYDTGHKYYGLIDLFLGIGGGGAGGTRGLGLQDFALKGKINPAAGWTLKADYHWFWTAECVSCNTTTTNVASTGADSNFLGNELDITAVTKMNANTKVMIGFSNYSTSQSMRLLKGTTGANGIQGNDMNWGYVQFDVKF